MNRERARSLLPIIQAFADGKIIQTKYNDRRYRKDTWFDTPDPEWYEHHDHRIKPEPREFWLYPIGNEWGGVDSEDKAKPYSGVFKVREVIE